MFNRCEFVMGKNKSVVVMVPAYLPKGGEITMTIDGADVYFHHSGETLIGRAECQCAKTLRALRKKKRVGLIEAINGNPPFPVYISAIARLIVKSTNLPMQAVA